MALSPAILVVFLLSLVYSFFSLGALFILVIRLESLHEAHSRHGKRGRETPLLSVVIPCRNEAADIARCLDSILAQDYERMEVIVVDGNSEDGTWEILQNYGDGIRAVREKSIPDGWTGKNWAAYSGYRISSGEFILFADADMVLKQSLLTISMETVEGEGIDMLSLGPDIKMIGFWEKAVLPLFAQFVMLLFLPQLMNRDISNWSMANGQFMLMPRKSYEAAGTHGGIRGMIVEDIALAREFRRSGLKVRFYWAGGLISTRMYSSGAEMKGGIVRDLQASIGTGYAAYMLDLLYLALTFYLPVAMVAYSVLAHQFILLVIGAITLLFVILRMLVFQAGTGSPLLYSLIFPVPVGAYMYMICSAFFRALTGKPVEWKGREYGTPGAR